MSASIKTIREDVNRLSQDERAELIDTLIADHAMPEDSLLAAWAEESDRRFVAYKAGAVRGLTLDEVTAKRCR
jgi:putative addiction module component (TIGR02574 family)